jgi:hypothetical protein
MIRFLLLAMLPMTSILAAAPWIGPNPDEQDRRHAVILGLVPTGEGLLADLVYEYHNSYPRTALRAHLGHHSQDEETNHYGYGISLATIGGHIRLFDGAHHKVLLIGEAGGQLFDTDWHSEWTWRAGVGLGYRYRPSWLGPAFLELEGHWAAFGPVTYQDKSESYITRDERGAVLLGIGLLL